MFLLVPAYQGCPGSKAVKRSLLLLSLFGTPFTYTGWPQSRRKKFPKFPGFSRAINLLFHRLLLHTFNGPLSGTTQVSRYQKGKINLDFTEARDSEWQWHQLGHMQVCTSLQTDNHASNTPLSFLQAGCPSCRPTNSIKALKA